MIYLLLACGFVLLVTQGAALIYAIHQSKKNTDIVLDLAKSVGGVTEVMRQFLGRMEQALPQPRSQVNTAEIERLVERQEERPWEEQVNDWKAQASEYKHELARKLEMARRIQEIAKIRREQEAMTTQAGRAAQAEQGPIEEPTDMDD